jgi:hypothetical protein
VVGLGVRHLWKFLTVVFASILITNPLRMKLSDGPCENCKRWFIKKRLTQKSNRCSRRCRDIIRAGVRNKEVRERKHEEKLKLARRLIGEWRKASAREKKKFRNWKEFIEWKSKKELTKKFVTRAVTNKELMPPKGRAQ